MSSDFSAFSQRHSISVVSHGISKADKLLDEEVASADTGSPLSINSPRSHCAASPSPGPSSSYLSPSDSYSEQFSFSPVPVKNLNLNYVESHPDAFSFDQANPDHIQTAGPTASRTVEKYVVSEKLDHFLANVAPPTPFLVMDLDIVEDNYRSLAAALPFARVFFAVKANPERAIVERLTGLGSCFDTASRNEIDQVLAAGNSADRISFGNTIKKQKDIQYAFSKGVRVFAFDSERELIKLAQAAPGARVFCRILVDCVGAEWPLSKKFGCTPELAIELLVKAQSLGLDAYGVSFHPGSQQTNLDQWDLCLGEAGRVFSSCSEQGVQLRMVNIGGGFPARYRKAVAPLHAYAAAVSAGLEKHFPGPKPEVIIEPGRAMVGDAGVLQTEVVLVSRKGLPDQPDAEKRWVYLDAGKFNGLSETMDESIKYRIRTPNNDGPRGPVVLAGPTCDSADILYEKNTYMLPLDIDVGDKIEFLSAGAYSTSLSAVNFNGFDPLTCYCI